MKTLVILAGGLSTRMGRDKALLVINGETFIERICRNALIWFDRGIISAGSADHENRLKELPFLRESAVETVTDLYEKRGPLGGIVSVLESTDAESFAVISTDVPGADMEVLLRLYDERERLGVKAACLELEGHVEPLIAAYGRTALPDFKRALEEGNNKIRAALREDDIAVIRADNRDVANAFANINTPKEYEGLC